MVSIPVLGATMTVRDLSLGGLAVDGSLRFARGETYELVVTPAGESPLHVRARVAWCHGRDREERFLTGWEVLGDQDSTRAMATLVERFTGASAASGGRPSPSVDPGTARPSAAENGPRPSPLPA